jgi:hypothetical protein
MGEMFGHLVSYGWVLALVLIVVFHKAVLRVFFGTVIVSKEEIGIFAGGGGSQGGTLVDVLLANLIRDNMKASSLDATPPTEEK